MERESWIKGERSHGPFRIHLQELMLQLHSVRRHLASRAAIKLIGNACDDSKGLNIRRAQTRPIAMNMLRAVHLPGCGSYHAE